MPRGEAERWGAMFYFRSFGKNSDFLFRNIKRNGTPTIQPIGKITIHQTIESPIPHLKNQDRRSFILRSATRIRITPISPGADPQMMDKRATLIFPARTVASGLPSAASVENVRIIWITPMVNP